MAELRVRIGPSVDRAAFDAAFSSIGQSAKRAFEKVASESAKAGDQEVRAAKKTAATVGQTRLTETERTGRKVADAVAREERKKIAAAERAARERAAIEVMHFRGLTAQHRAAERSSARMYTEMQRQAKDAANAMKFEAAKARPRFGVSLGHGASVAMSGIWGAGASLARMGLGVAGDIAHAYGVNTSVGTAMERNADLETLAMQITNEAHEKGQAFANPEDLKEQAFNVGNKTGTSANKVMEGFQEFVGKTGDLKTASATMEQLAKIAKSTGSSLKDVVGAAADVSNQLGDIPNKGAKVISVMQGFAGEAKRGAVPMRALASQMSKVVASANMYEGDVGHNMVLLGALAQQTKLRGGAANAAQATTAVNSLSSVFRTKARVAAFDKAGININGAGGKLKGIDDIIVESLQKTQRGTRSQSNVALNNLWGGKLPGKTIGGVEDVFRSTYASASGTEQERLAEATKAARKTLDDLVRSGMDEKEVQDSFTRAMQTGQSQAELWNNATQKAAGEMQKQLLPAMIAFTPKVVEAAGAFARFIDFLAGKDHPPDGSPLSQDMDAIHKAMRAPGGKVDKALVDKAIKDSQVLGAAATEKENEARGLKNNRAGNVAFHAADIAGSSHMDRYTDFTGLGGIYDFVKNITSGKAGKAADAEQSTAARQAKDASDQAMKAFDELRSATLKVHIVSSDVKAGEVNGAATPSTDTLSHHPSGP